MFSPLKKMSLTHYAMTLTVLMVVIRLISLAIYPLMDTTEARYGEMARIMYETGNWITPMFDYNVPFWGKPPLFTWLSAAGFATLGGNEFAARVPHLVVGVLILLLVWVIAKKRSNDSTEQAWLAVAILATTVAFIVNAGAVMTDTALTLGITLSMVGFWLSWAEKSRFWGYMFFVGLAIGMLAKGPLALVLVGISLTIWLASEQRWKNLLQCLPWKGGVALFLLLSLPWYLLAEWKSPGFLNYFIIGEHVKRFIVSGWQGDLYGTAHREVRGTIWLYWALATLPWTPVLIYQTTRFFKAGKESVVSGDGYFGFLWCWMVATLILFTFSGNILASYVMPGLPAFALLIAGYQGKLKLPEKVYRIGLITPVLVLVTAFLLGYDIIPKKSEKGMMQQWQAQPEAHSVPLTYIGKRPFSAQFYSQGRAQKYSGSLLDFVNGQNESHFIVIKKRELDSDMLLQQHGCEHRAESAKRVLLFCPNIVTNIE